MNREQVIALIEASSFDATTKAQWVARIHAEGLTQDVIDGIKDAMQASIDAGFTALGVSLDENDPEYKAKHAAMMAEVEAANAEFETAMADLQAQAKAVQAEAMADMDKLEAEAIKASI